MSLFAMQEELTAEQRLSKNVVAIMNDDRHVAMAGLLMVLSGMSVIPHQRRVLTAEMCGSGVRLWTR